MSVKRITFGIFGLVLIAGVTIGLLATFNSVAAADGLMAAANGCTPPGAADPGTNSLISYWPLNETAGATTFSDVVSSHDGTCSGDACPEAGVGGVALNAAQFSASESDVVVVTSHTDFDFTSADDLSLGLWVKTTQDCTGIQDDNKVFFGRYRNASANGTWWLGCVPGEGDSTKGVAAFHMRDSDNVVRRAVGTTKINDGLWHYLVGVRDGTADENYIYVDGSLENTVDTPAFTGTFSGDDDLTMGAYDVSGPGYYYQGVLDEVTFYTRVLGDTEISDYEGTCSPSENTPPTVGDVNFETDMDVPLQISEAQLLANSSDTDGDTLSVSAVDAASAQGGTVTGALPGPVTYTPPAGYTGPDSFNFDVTDGIDTTQGTANIQVKEPLKYIYLPIILK